MPKFKRGPRNTPPPMTIVIKDVPYPVAKKPDETKPSVAAEAPTLARDDPKPHYY